MLPDLGLPADVRVCVDQDWLIFLDLSRDRYWAIARAQSQERILAQLERRGLTGARPPPRSVHLWWSALVRRMPCWMAYADAARWARAIEKSGDLSAAFAWISARKAANRAHRGDRPQREDRPGRPNFLAALRQADALRLWVPHRYICLFDALAHGRFLLQKGFDVDLVFGVRGRPFAAHCWLEAEGKLIDAGQEDCASFALIARA